jgi:DNA polymerase-3 subunit alpha
LSECQRLGLKILLPDINASRVECIGEDDWVRIGLLRVKGVQEKTKKSIVAEREQHGRFTSLQNFLERVPVDDDEMERLIMAGVFNHLEPKLTPGAMQYLYLY